MLEVKKLSFSYQKGKETLDDVSLSLPEGKIGILLGKNGSGKSTLLKCVAGLYRDYRGEILLKENNLKKTPIRERAKLVSYLSQTPESSSLTVYDTLLLGRLPFSAFLSRKESEPYVFPIVERLGLETFVDKRTDQLSGGERQRVMIAKSLIQETPLILLDEPTASLDVSHQLSVLKILKRECEEKQISVLLSLHDINTALRFGDVFYFLKEGKLQKACTKEEVTDNLLREVYDAPLCLREDEYGKYVTIGE